MNLVKRIKNSPQFYGKNFYHYNKRKIAAIDGYEEAEEEAGENDENDELKEDLKELKEILENKGKLR